MSLELSERGVRCAGVWETMGGVLQAMPGRQAYAASRHLQSIHHPACSLLQTIDCIFLLGVVHAYTAVRLRTTASSGMWGYDTDTAAVCWNSAPQPSPPSLSMSLGIPSRTANRSTASIYSQQFTASPKDFPLATSIVLSLWTFMQVLSVNSTEEGLFCSSTAVVQLQHPPL